MLTQLATTNSRLSILATASDALLTNALKAVSARFDNECNRTFARAVNATHEFSAEEIELRPPCYPIEAVTKFELKSNEADGWSEQTGVAYLIRRQCVISLCAPLSSLNSPLAIARLT